MLVGFILLLRFGAAGQAVLVNWDHLNFSSHYEEGLFQALRAGDWVDDHAILLAMSPGVTAEAVAAEAAKMEASFSRMEAAAPGKPGSSRQLVYFFRSLRSQYFQQYAPVADLGDILAEGTFNCVSSSAMMALALDHAGISWQLVEKPGHVYLLAECKGRTYQVETTSETIGVFRSVSAQPKWFAQVGAPSGPRDFVRDGLRQLAGLQYYNAGLQAMDEEAYAHALDQFSKAWLLSPRHAVAEMWEVAVAAVEQKGKDLLIAGAPVAALALLEKVQAVRAKEPSYQLAVMGAVLMQVEQSKNYLANVAKLEAAMVAYPFLEGEEAMAHALSDCWLLAANAAYERDDVPAAEAALRAFESVCATQPHLANGPLVAYVYAEGWTRLVRKGELKAAEAMLARALRFAPNSETLGRKRAATLAMRQ